MVQALSNSTAFARRSRPPQLLNQEGKCYPYYKPIPIKRIALRKIKLNENCSTDTQRYCFDPHPPNAHLSHQQKSKRTLTHAYHNMQQQNREPQRPLLSTVSMSENMIDQKESKRRVRFSKSMEVYKLPARTSEDNYRSWYNKNDYVRFSNERRKDVYLIQQVIVSYQLNSSIDIDEYLDPNELTIVGVEQYIHGKEQIVCRKLQMLRHTRSILQQQHQQQQQQQYHKLHFEQQQHDAEMYYYPEMYDIDASKYHPMYYQQHQVTSDESYLRRHALYPCAATMQYPINCANNPIQHALHA